MSLSTYVPNFTSPDPRAAQLRAALVANDWSGVEQTFNGVDANAASSLVRVGGEVKGIEAFLTAIVAQRPTDVLAASLLASHLIEVGWEIRTNARASQVSREQFEAFHQYLRRAEQLLIDATARQPDYAPAWVCRLITARGLGLGQSEARRRYDMLNRYVPNHLPAQLQYQQQLCPKWGGSWDAMEAFAKESMLAAPEGALNAVLVPAGHMERWLSLPSGEDEKHFLDPKVQADIREAAARSVAHPNYRRVPGWIYVENEFAAAACLMQDYRVAAWHFNNLGEYATDSPWSYFGDPAEKITYYRNLALGAAQ